MRSLKNHFSLIIALLSILFSIQTFVVIQRALDAYEKNLLQNYSVVIVSKNDIDKNEIMLMDSSIVDVDKLSPDSVIKRLNTGINSKNMELLKLTLPRFYQLKLSHYPSPEELNKLTENLLFNDAIMKVESFSKSHNTIYKLLFLFKNVILVFSLVVVIVTILLIFKELRIWQFNHSERMNVMGLFGAPIWLSSAVLFRLAIVDALISSFFAFLIFSYLSSKKFIVDEFINIGINIVIFDKVNDTLSLLGISIVVSIILAVMIVLGHKEEA